MASCTRSRRTRCSHIGSRPDRRLTGRDPPPLRLTLDSLDIGLPRCIALTRALYLPRIAALTRSIRSRSSSRRVHPFPLLFCSLLDSVVIVVLLSSLMIRSTCCGTRSHATRNDEQGQQRSGPLSRAALLDFSCLFLCPLFILPAASQHMPHAHVRTITCTTHPRINSFQRAVILQLCS